MVSIFYNGIIPFVFRHEELGNVKFHNDFLYLNNRPQV